MLAVRAHSVGNFKNLGDEILCCVVGWVWGLGGVCCGQLPRMGAF